MTKQTPLQRLAITLDETLGESFQRPSPKSRTWIRAIGEITQVIEIELPKHARAGEFTVAWGLAPSSYRELVFGWSSDEPWRAADCAISGRIGHLRWPVKDLWWNLQQDFDTAAESLAAETLGRLVPFLDTVTSVSDMLSILETSNPIQRSWPGPRRQEKTVRAALEALRGDTAVARQLLDDLGPQGTVPPDAASRIEAII